MTENLKGTYDQMYSRWTTDGRITAEELKEAEAMIDSDKAPKGSFFSSKYMQADIDFYRRIEGAMQKDGCARIDADAKAYFAKNFSGVRGAIDKNKTWGLASSIFFSTTATLGVAALILSPDPISKIALLGGAIGFFCEGTLVNAGVNSYRTGNNFSVPIIDDD